MQANKDVNKESSGASTHTHTHAHTCACGHTHCVGSAKAPYRVTGLHCRNTPSSDGGCGSHPSGVTMHREGWLLPASQSDVISPSPPQLLEGGGSTNKTYPHGFLGSFLRRYSWVGQGG